MGKSLYDIEKDNSELLMDSRLRWRTMCLDVDLMCRKPKRIHRLAISWKRAHFLTKNSSAIPTAQGVYMFVLNPGRYRNIDETSKYVLYIGQANNLRERFNSYFSYKSDTKPSNLLKRIMVVIWEGKLDFHFFQTGHLSTAELTEVEFDLIDMLVPPLNQRFRGVFVKRGVKLYAAR